MSSDRYQILTGDATRSSILVINKLSYTDEGTYSCAVNHVSQTASRVRNVTLQLQSKHHRVFVHALLFIPAATIEIEQDFITLETGQNVTLDCEMYGYLRGKIEWLKNGQQVQSGGRYSITVRTGSREGQDGGEDSVSSVVSQLTIQEVEEGDEGIYTCRVRNIQSTNFVALTVISSEYSIHTLCYYNVHHFATDVLSSVVVPSQTFLSSLTSPPINYITDTCSNHHTIDLTSSKFGSVSYRRNYWHSNWTHSFSYSYTSFELLLLHDRNNQKIKNWKQGLGFT